MIFDLLEHLAEHCFGTSATWRKNVLLQRCSREYHQPAQYRCSRAQTKRGRVIDCPSRSTYPVGGRLVHSEGTITRGGNVLSATVDNMLELLNVGIDAFAMCEVGDGTP